MLNVIGAVGMLALPTLIMLLVRRWMLRHRRALEASGRWAEGVVVSRPVTTSRDNTSSVRIVVEYRDEHGTARQVKSISTSSSFPKVGSPARVLYVPGDPSSARIAADIANQVWIFTLLSAIFGSLTVLAVVGIGVALIFFREPFLESIAYELPDSTAPPGDIVAYQPFSHLDTIAAFAGPDAELISIEALNVRPDGTLELGEKSDRGIAWVVLEFIADPTERDKRTLDEVTDKVIVRVTVREPNEVRTSSGVSTRQGGGTTKRFDRGMRRVPANYSIAPGAEPKIAPRPRCSAAELMGIARSRGALKILARIEYDAQGYELHTWKKGAAMSLRFDHDCELIAR